MLLFSRTMILAAAAVVMTVPKTSALADEGKGSRACLLVADNVYKATVEISTRRLIEVAMRRLTLGTPQMGEAIATENTSRSNSSARV